MSEANACECPLPIPYFLDFSVSERMDGWMDGWTGGNMAAARTDCSCVEFSCSCFVKHRARALGVGWMGNEILCGIRGVG